MADKTWREMTIPERVKYLRDEMLTARGDAITARKKVAVLAAELNKTNERLKKLAAMVESSS
jgi:hypothetical protein